MSPHQPMPGRPSPNQPAHLPGQPARRGLLIVVGSLVLFVVALLVANPVGDFLSAHGVPTAVIGAGMLLVALLLVGGPMLLLWRGRHQRQQLRAAMTTPAVADWAHRAGWQQGQWGPGPPAVLQRARVISSHNELTALGQVAGRQATLMVWQQAFANRGSPIQDRGTALVLVVSDLPTDVSFGMGRLSAPDTTMAGRAPARWAAYPPLALTSQAPRSPWGRGRTLLWPGPGTPPPDRLTAVAGELDALGAWLLLHGGQLEVSVWVDGTLVPPDRLEALAGAVVTALQPHR